MSEKQLTRVSGRFGTLTRLSRELPMRRGETMFLDVHGRKDLSSALLAVLEQFGDKGELVTEPPDTSDVEWRITIERVQ